MSNYVVTALQLSLENFGRNGLTTVSGENVAVVIHWVLVVITTFTEVRKLTTKKPIHIFEGFTLC